MYVIYHKETTRLLTNPRMHSLLAKKIYKTERAPKTGLTILSNRNESITKSDYAIAEFNDFKINIEKTEVVKNLMSGKDVTQSVNTPHCCDPSTESYWSM